MLVVGLTGGIGSGKSTVAGMLARRGAVVLDADVIAREVVEPGTEGFQEVVETFGDHVVGSDGALDRQALARVVFDDAGARKRLESIVHPKVGVRIAEQVQAHAGRDAIVVLDVPLMAEAREGSGRFADAIVVVDAPDELRLDRLEARGMDRADAASRMAAQASREERLAIADEVVANDGTLDELEARVEELWKRLEDRAKTQART